MRLTHLCLIIILAFLSCAVRQNLAALEPDAEFERAMSFYNARKYNQAIEAFQRILFYHASSEYVDDAQYWLGRTYLEQKQYDQAIIEFDYLIKNFPNSTQQEDAFFFQAKAYLHNAPSYEKDLTELDKAVRLFDEFLTRFPNSEYTDSVRAEILIARDRLAKKELENGKLYAKLNDLDAALLYFRYVINNYSETPSASEAKYRSAEIYEKKGQDEQALELYKELLQDAIWQDRAAQCISDLGKGS